MSDDPVLDGHDFLNAAIRDKAATRVPASDAHASDPVTTPRKPGGRLAGGPGGRGAPPRTTTYAEANAELTAGLRAAVRRKRGY